MGSFTDGYTVCRDAVALRQAAQRREFGENAAILARELWLILTDREVEATATASGFKETSKIISELLDLETEMRLPPRGVVEREKLARRTSNTMNRVELLMETLRFHDRQQRVAAGQLSVMP